jgi:ribosomal protein S27AE
MNLFLGSSVFPVRPECPDCAMNMIVAKGFDLDREAQTFECLRCGHFEKSQRRRSQAAE